MIKTLYRPKRWRNGKRIVSRLYSLKLRVDGELHISTIALGVSDQGAATEKVRKLVKEREQELAGWLPPKAQREAAQASFTKHVRDFIGDLRIKGRNPRYADEMEFKLTTLAEKCCWRQVNEITADSFVSWRSTQTKGKKTLNEYLAGVPLRELMRHSDVRLTMKIYADSSLFALRPAIEKLLPWNCPDDDSQRDSQRNGFGGLLPSLPVTVDGVVKSEISPVELGLKSLSDAEWHEVAKSREWCALQVSNLRPLPCEGNALPLS